MTTGDGATGIAPHTNMTHDILLIPGIGGHPRFHQPVIDVLARCNFRVHSDAHGDFFAEPYVGITPHVSHWRARMRAIDADSLIILAISFGAHVVPGLLRDGSVRVSRVVLLSPWLPGIPGRLALGLAGALPTEAFAGWLAERLMRWSEQDGDLDAIQKLRAELYDDTEMVAARWRQRLLAMREGLDWGELDTLAQVAPVDLVYGRDELIYRLQRQRLEALAARRSGLTLWRIEGGHEIGQTLASGLEETLDTLLSHQGSSSQDHLAQMLP